VDLKEMFKTVDTVLVIDWPTKDVPEMLALAGFHVVVRGGPGPEDYSAYELNNGEVAAHHSANCRKSSPRPRASMRRPYGPNPAYPLPG
jgi:hypothetical protein